MLPWWHEQTWLSLAVFVQGKNTSRKSYIHENFTWNVSDNDSDNDNDNHVCDNTASDNHVSDYVIMLVIMLCNYVSDYDNHASHNHVKYR